MMNTTARQLRDSQTANMGQDCHQRGVQSLVQWGWWPLLPEILGQPAPVGAKSLILNRYLLTAPQPLHLAKKVQLTHFCLFRKLGLGERMVREATTAVWKGVPKAPMPRRGMRLYMRSKTHQTETPKASTGWICAFLMMLWWNNVDSWHTHVHVLHYVVGTLAIVFCITLQYHKYLCAYATTCYIWKFWFVTFRWWAFCNISAAQWIRRLLPLLVTMLFCPRRECRLTCYFHNDGKHVLHFTGVLM